MRDDTTPLLITVLGYVKKSIYQSRLYEDFEQAPVTQHVVLSVDSPRDLPARIVDTDADVTMSLGK